MKGLIMIALAAFIVAGCCGSVPQAPPTSVGQEIPVQTGGNQNTSQTTSGSQTNTTPPAPTGDGTIVDVGGSIGGNGTASNQGDCATLTPNCGDCVAKAGCGWCKSSAGCYKGDANGPSGDVNCQSGDWATTPQSCQAPVGGSSCSSKTNCADCLSGSGCQWCQEGTKCADATSADSCASGGWRTTSYQCYGGQ